LSSKIGGIEFIGLASANQRKRGAKFRNRRNTGATGKRFQSLPTGIEPATSSLGIVLGRLLRLILRNATAQDGATKRKIPHLTHPRRTCYEDY